MKFFEFDYCSVFVVIWQLVFIHELIRFKRFISLFTVELCNQLFLSTVFNIFYVCIQRFDVICTVGKFFRK